ncbi:MAG: type II CAAX endopeptidase family protein [Phycisphaerales bacterium]
MQTPEPESPVVAATDDGAGAAPLPTGPGEADAALRRVLWVELLVVVVFGVLAHTVNAVVSLYVESAHPGWVIDAVMTTTSAASISAVMLYLMWRSPEGLRGFGVLRIGWQDVGVAVGVFAASWAVPWVLWFVLWNLPVVVELYDATMPDDIEAAEMEAMFPAPTGLADRASIVALSLANSLSEQLVISAYLVTRLERLLGSAVKAVVVATCLFASYHIYQGVWAMPSILAMGLVFTATFRLTGRLWGIVAAHAAYDAVVMIWY